MKKIIKRHKDFWSNKDFIISSIFGAVFFITGGIIHYNAGIFATANESNFVTDLLLAHLPVVDVSIIFVDGVILFWVFIIILLLNKPQRIPFVLKNLALFMIIRSAFIIMTHLGSDPREITISPNIIIDKFTFGGDYFFSGHTGAPFLMSLIFWHNSYLRWLFLLASIIFGVSVLMGHLHYSIDVFSAYFITYGVFQICLKFFKKDYQLLTVEF